MAKQIIGVGAQPDDGTGDTLRAAFIKVNDNFTELYDDDAADNLDAVTTLGNTTTNSITVGGLVVDTDTLVVDSANNRVGIGTTSPSAKFDVNGTGIFRDQLNIDPSGDPNNVLSLNARVSNDYSNLVFRNGGGTADWAELVATTNTLAFETGGTERLRIDSSGRVGIGTTSPSAKLEVKAAQSTSPFPSPALKLSNSTLTNNTGLTSITLATSSVDDYGVSLNSWRYGTTGDPKFVVKMHSGTSSGIDALTINSSGNVGIGETSIDAKLHITTPTAGLVNQKFESAGSAAWRLGIPASQTYFAFDNSNDSLGSPKLVIDSSGNVGIGTTSPDSPLTIMAEVQASVPSAGESSSHIAIGKNNQYGTMIGTLGSGLGYIQQQRFDGAATTYDLLIQPNGGNVGIGETDPSRQLHVKGSTSTYVRIEANSSNNSAVEFADENDANVGRIQYEHLVDNMTFRVNDAEAMRIDSSGNVGIGTTSPNASGSRKTLHIEDSDGAAIRLADDGVSSLIRYDNTNGLSIGTVGSNNVVLSTSDTERMRINSSGNVGIGTTSPLVKTQISTNLSSGSVQDALLLSQNTATSSSGQGVKMYLSSSNSIIRAAAIEAIAGSSNDHSLGFYTNSAFAPPAERMRIDSSGNVGIGSSLSGGLLDKVIIKTGGQGVIKDALMLTTGDADNYAGTGVRINMSGVSEANSDIRHAYIEAATTTGNNDHYLAFATNSTGGDATERMRINSIGRVGIGTTSPAALLDISSTTDGVLLPRMTTTQVNAISSPENGLTVYNTTLNTLCFYNGTSWQKVTSSNM